MRSARRKFSKSEGQKVQDIIVTRKKILKIKIRMKGHFVTGQRNMEAAQFSPPTCSHEAIKRGYKGYKA
jgi:hypothetical protein